jgi:hypothetical protein
MLFTCYPIYLMYEGLPTMPICGTRTGFIRLYVSFDDVQNPGSFPLVVDLNDSKLALLILGTTWKQDELEHIDDGFKEGHEVVLDKLPYGLSRTR